jgi:hypothetical protein
MNGIYFWFALDSVPIRQTKLSELGLQNMHPCRRSRCRLLRRRSPLDGCTPSLSWPMVVFGVGVTVHFTSSDTILLPQHPCWFTRAFSRQCPRAVFTRWQFTTMVVPSHGVNLRPHVILLDILRQLPSPQVPSSAKSWSQFTQRPKSPPLLSSRKVAC